MAPPRMLRDELLALIALAAAAVLLVGAIILGIAQSSSLVPTLTIVAAVGALSVLWRSDARRSRRHLARMEERLLRLENALRDRSAELGAMSQLGHLGDPYPLWFGGWALGADSAAELVRQLHARRPSRTLEAGSGVSTLIMARYFREQVPGTGGVAAVGPGSAGYHGGHWMVYLVSWNVGQRPLTSAAAVLDAAATGDITITRAADQDFNCPIQP